MFLSPKSFGISQRIDIIICLYFYDWRNNWEIH